MRTTSLQVDRDVLMKTKYKAFREGKSMGEVIRELLVAYTSGVVVPEESAKWFGR